MISTTFWNFEKMYVQKADVDFIKQKTVFKLEAAVL